MKLMTNNLSLENNVNIKIIKLYTHNLHLVNSWLKKEKVHQIFAQNVEIKPKNKLNVNFVQKSFA
jgi:hypothetical protein